MRGPKEKKERALGERLYLKGERCASPKCAMVRKPYRPGMHGQKRHRVKNVSEYGLQEREKQKFKLSYGIDERNLRRLFRGAEREAGSTAVKLAELLELRLDNVVYRLGFAPSRGAARQRIVHGHIAVNGTRVRAPGYEVRAGDAIAFREASRGRSFVKLLSESLGKYEPPSWLALDREKLEGKVLSPPTDFTPPFEINLLVESLNK